MISGGYSVPKDTSVLANFYGLHFNEEFWPAPFEYKPGKALSLSFYLKYFPLQIIQFAMAFKDTAVDFTKLFLT